MKRPIFQPVLVLILFISGAGNGWPGQDAPESLHPELAVARWYAPILWPAVFETVWPMLPHALAFDGEDNDCNDLIDLEDPFEASFGSCFQEAKMHEL